MAARNIMKSLSLDVEIVEWLEKEAELENRSVSNLIETILIRKREEMEATTETEKLEVTAGSVVRGLTSAA